MDWKSEPELVEVPDPQPGPGEVVVRIGGAGACHSDLHLMHDFEGGVLPWSPPFTLGHENAGWVHAIGEGVTRVAVGQPVAVYGPWGCGVCSRCAVGIENYCEDPMRAPVPSGGGGLGLDGGMADLMLVPDARLLVPLPDGLDPVTAAGLTDAGLTPFHAIRRSRHLLTADASIVLIGVGGLGHVGVQIARELGPASVIAVDTKSSALDLATKVGADHTVLSGDDAAEIIRDLTHGRGADVVVDFVGAAPTIELARRVARPLGDVALVGIAGGESRSPSSASRMRSPWRPRTGAPDPSWSSCWPWPHADGSRSSTRCIDSTTRSTPTGRSSAARSRAAPSSCPAETARSTSRGSVTVGTSWLVGRRAVA
jgi:propanol-preferring alcohol dehydrogenase